MPSLPIIDSNLQEDIEYERDYSKIDLVDLIEQPAWKTILIDLVKSNKMNPWDIDVSLLTEKYIEKINNLDTCSLHVPANAILACAILVKTKSRYLKLSSIDDDVDDNNVLTEEQKIHLLEEIPDLMASRSMREGRISLDELVESIEGIIQNTTPSKSSFRDIPKMEFNFDTISIEKRLEEVLDLIKQKVDSQGLVMFNSLLNRKDNETIINTFLPVLFLMNSGKILVYQEEFFGDIFVKIISISNNEKVN
ncbi:MAG: segregation/condensation protein A [Candidatus ainarchaeum sp.]|nr:segregation/condensation protein A [Candidatus ainarchaeum sp.]